MEPENIPKGRSCSSDLFSSSMLNFGGCSHFMVMPSEFFV